MFFPARRFATVRLPPVGRAAESAVIAAPTQTFDDSLNTSIHSSCQRPKSGDFGYRGHKRPLSLDTKGNGMHARFYAGMAVVAVVFASSFPNAAVADPLWSKLLFLKGPEADPNTTYYLSEEDGPWMVMAATFEGEGAQQQANDLVYELRAQHKLEAFVHRAKFDFTKDLPDRQTARFGAPVRVRYRREGSEQFAVLVGSFPSVADKKAQKTLRKIKSLSTKTLETSTKKLTYQYLANWRAFTRRQNKAKSDNARSSEQRGQMGKAFIVPNPLLPEDYFSNDGLDPLVVKMNDSIQYSLFDCPGKYTVQVATFRGRSIIKQSTIKAIESGEKKLKHSLVEAAENAHKLTIALRAKGYEAYQFHDIHVSIVTVGSFNTVGNQQANGKTLVHPQIERIMTTFGSGRTAAGGRVMLPNDLVGIKFDMRPIPVVVPRRPISRDYENSRFSLLP